MINSRKKGFTLVELVIVIAVIAILAAVLIPTFSSLVKKANLSADKQAERQLNTLLATEFATEKPEDLRAIVDMLDANGYRTSLEPLSKGYVFAWDKENNKIVLVLEAEAGSYAANLADGAKYYNEEVKDSQKFAEALKSGSDVTLSANVSVSEAIALYDDVVIDLNGHDIDFSANSSRPFELYDNASLTINAEGSTIKCGKFGMINVSPTTKNANIVINGGNFVGETDNGSFIKVRNGNENINVILNNVNYTDSGSGFILDATYKVANGNLGFGGNLSLTIDGGIYNAPKGFNLADGEYIFKNASITSQKNTITADAGATLTIDNCSIKQLSNEYKGVVCAGNEAKITISNSTISGDADSAYAVLDTGGTIIVNNTKYETKSEYYIYPNAGSKATIIINGQEK